jgi:uncharacterized membrane protein
MGSADDNISATSRETDPNDIKLYFHRDNLLDTSEPTSQTSAPHSFSVNSDIEFRLSPALFSNLNTIGRAKVGTQDALWLDVTIDYTILTGSVTLNINVIEEKSSSSSSTIASNSFAFDGSSTEDTFLIPFTGSKTDHTFSAGSVIKVNFSATVPTGASFRMSYDSANSPHGFIYLTSYQIGAMSLGAFHDDGTSGDFEPNARDHRVISFQGEVEDAFGGYDINMVTLDVPTLSQFPSGASATINAVNEKAHYIYNWSYPYGLPPGQYQVDATIQDNSGNTFSDSTTFTISSYGVHLHIVEPEKSNEKGKTVVFDLEVTNVGGASDTITLSASPSVSWPTQFSENSVSVGPNATRDVTLTVSIPNNADDNQHNTITVTATSNGDASKKMSTDAIATAMPASGFSFELLSDTPQEIEDGNTATYNFRLQNIGSNPETYVITIDDNPAPGWQVNLEGGDSVPPGTSYIRRESSLGKGGQLNLVLTVTASGPSTTTEDVIVSAAPKNDTGKAVSITTTTKLFKEGELELSLESQSIQTSEVIDASASVPSYEGLTYTVNVYNSGPEVAVSFDVTLPTLASNWEVTQPSDITVDEDSDKSVSFTVTPSSDAQANEGDGYTITFRATPTDGSSKSVKISVKAMVMQFYKIDVDMETKGSVSGDNQKVDYDISIQNKGNGIDVVSIIVSENEWDYQWSSVPLSAEMLGNLLKVSIGPGATTTVTLTFTSPDNTRNGDEDSAIVIVRSTNFQTTDDSTYKKFPITNKVEKSGGEAFMDAISDLWIPIVLVIAVIIIAAFIKIKLKEKQRR